MGLQRFFCFGPITCRLSNRLKIWGLLYLVLYPGNLMLKQNFLNAQNFRLPQTNIPFPVSSYRKSQLYKSLILPTLLYGAFAWSPSLPMLHQLKLFQ